MQCQGSHWVETPARPVPPGCTVSLAYYRICHWCIPGAFHICIPADAGRGDVLAGVTKKQAAWLLGETLRDEELSVQKRLFNNLSIKL